MLAHLVSTCLQFLSHCAVMFRSSQARGAFGHTGVAAPLLRRLGLDGEGMNAGTEFLLQGFIHEPMTLQQGQTLELGTHHENSEVGF